MDEKDRTGICGDRLPFFDERGVYVRPVEVKSSKRYDHTSLDKFRAKFRNALGPTYVLHSKDVKVENGITFLPLCMTPCL